VASAGPHVVPSGGRAVVLPHEKQLHVGPQSIATPSHLPAAFSVHSFGADGGNAPHWHGPVEVPLQAVQPRVGTSAQTSERGFEIPLTSGV
jgi:hypothetical protein